MLGKKIIVQIFRLIETGTREPGVGGGGQWGRHTRMTNECKNGVG